MKINRLLLVLPAMLLLLFAFKPGAGIFSRIHHREPAQDSSYLFAYFTGGEGGKEAIHFAVSDDGKRYSGLNNNRQVLPDAISSTGGVRDPHIMRGPDGKTFYMVATDMNVAKNQWGPNRAMVLLKSRDLVNWSSAVVNVTELFPKFKSATRVWAPETIYDRKAKKLMIYWSMPAPGGDKIFYSYANKDFTGLETEPKQLFYPADSTTGCIDGHIVEWKGNFNLFYKATGKTGTGIRNATSASLITGYKDNSKLLQQTADAVEGSDVFRVIGTNTWIMMYDLYRSRKYQFCESTDLENFRVIDAEVSMDFMPRHGTVMHISAKERERLLQKWGPVKTTRDTVRAPSAVLNGVFADPHIAVFGKKFYIYPTTDGSDGWLSSSFTCWSSNNLVNWKNEGVILDLPRDLAWAKVRAWAPAIAVKNKKYYYYYSADQNIGVAIADKPTCPFKDPLGKPFIRKGLVRGQMIDPMVFVDDDGSAYLYFGQGNCNIVKLNNDMVSCDTSAIISFKPPGYNEGSFVIKRKGIYYLMWSEFDTRDPRYSVAYATSASPTGPFVKAQGPPVLKGLGVVRGAGHHSVVQVPGKDEWYIAYHRFKIPGGNGYNRETCISRLQFDELGKILPVDVFAVVEPVKIK